MNSAVSVLLALALSVEPPAPAPAPAPAPEAEPLVLDDPADDQAEPSPQTPTDSPGDGDPSAVLEETETPNDPPAPAVAPPRVGASKWRTSDRSVEPSNEPGPDFESGVPPGGYWDPGEAPEVAPKDGAEQRLAGYILVPLGLLTAASGAAMVYLTQPGHCITRTSKVGYNLDEDDCQGLLILNSIRVGYGATAVITGAVLLAIGFRRKQKLEEWKRKRFRASVGFGSRLEPAVSAQVSLRF